MIQKQIALPEELDRQIQERAKRLQAPEERVIRELIEEGLNKKPQQQQPWKNAGEALKSLSELGIKGPKDLAINHDKYLYEKDE